MSHANKRIAAVWLGSLIFMLPICLLSELQPLGDTGNYKCREAWPSDLMEQIFAIFLDIVLLVIPLIVMSTTFGFIARTLWAGIEPKFNGDSSQELENRLPTQGFTRTATYSSSTGEIVETNNCCIQTKPQSLINTPKPIVSCSQPPLRSTNQEKALLQKKRIIKMLFVVVLEYFICWTPLYSINTLSHFFPYAVYRGLGYYGISFFQLLAYVSACCNPITYCFMNAKFRDSFLALAKCQRSVDRTGSSLSATFRSTMSASSGKDLSMDSKHMIKKNIK